jgi:tRNA (mo5U34)-methyltransferase
VFTPGGKGKGSGTRETFQQMHLPEDLTGKTVLDVGAWDSFYSFEAERRGARVLATDSFVWSEDFSNGAGKRGFDIAKRTLGSQVDEMFIEPDDLSAEKVGGTFDLVFFMGVLYHLRNPLATLEKVAAVTGDTLILETHVNLQFGEKRSCAAFYPTDECNADPTNWWGPNPLCVQDLLRP